MPTRVKSRDRILGAVFVLAVLAPQQFWMGESVSYLSGGLIIAYLLWASARWKNDPARILPVYLIAIAVQCLHFAEEFTTQFYRVFPKLFGSEWSASQFVVFNMLWLAMFVLAALGVYRQVALAYLVVLFLAAIGGVGNGASHLILSAKQGRYFPGSLTAPLCILAGAVLLLKLFGRSKHREA